MNVHKIIENARNNVGHEWADINEDVLLVIGIYYIIIIVASVFLGIINAGDLVFSIIAFGLAFIGSALILYHKYVIYFIKILMRWKNE